MDTQYVNPDTGAIVKDPEVRSRNSPQEIEQIQNFALEYGIYRLGYSLETAKRVAQNVGEALRRSQRAAA